MSREHALQQARSSVSCLGELLLDRPPSGPASVGGAPANVAFHLAQLGCPSCLISCVGCDEAGDKLRVWAEAGGIDVSMIQRCALAPTGSVVVGGPAHEPLYDMLYPAAWDFIEVTDVAIEVVRAAGVVVFGTLAQRHPCSRGSIRRLVDSAAAAGALRFADLNLRAPHFDDEIVLWTLRHADVLKLNVDELGIRIRAARCPRLHGGSLRRTDPRVRRPAWGAHSWRGRRVDSRERHRHA